MRRAVAIDLDADTRAVVAQLAADEGLALEVWDPAVTSTVPERTADIDLVVLGAVATPTRQIRRCQLALPRVPVIVVQPEAACRALAEALRISPFGARDVDCVPLEASDLLRERVHAALARHRRRASLGDALDSLNRQLAAAPAAQRGAAALLGRLLAIAPIGVAIIDRGGMVRELNPRAAQLLGGPGAGPIGAAIWQRFREPDAQRLRTLLAQLDDDGDVRHEVFARELDGRVCHIEISGAALPPATGTPGCLLVLEDATQRLQLVARLTAADRAKDEFLAMLGHELRNPLAPILTAVELLRMRDDPSLVQFTELIQRHVEHMVQLVDDLLDVARIAQGKLELRQRRTELVRVIAQAVEAASAQLEREAQRLEVDVPAHGLPVFADEGRLAQVFVNLLTNASKYSARGATIEITARVEADQVVARVSDHGPGIAPELLPRIFEPFVQERQSIERARGGLGLGLAIVKNLVTLHGGSVAAISELGRGSEFVIRLPLTEPADDAPAPAPARPAPSRLAGRRVLIVDDNVDAATLLADYLAMLGCRVETAHDGPDALQIGPPFQPQIVLLDIGLPVLDGYEVARRLRAIDTLASVPFIAISGYGHGDAHERSRQAGFFAHLVKPVSLEALRDALLRAMSAGDAPR
ncbi:MAG TPA: ATP-binding protein [Kofleriaceae bacterium]|jgi:PAS domain S-box-containing protein|nr:ATP-binding protein [Kofleriaceae bacterium]